MSDNVESVTHEILKGIQAGIVDVRAGISELRNEMRRDLTIWNRWPEKSGAIRRAPSS